LEFVVGREGGKVLDLQTVSSHFRTSGLSVAAMTGSGTAKDTRVSICSWKGSASNIFGSGKD
jgi:hypothetical protein